MPRAIILSRLSAAFFLAMVMGRLAGQPLGPEFERSYIYSPAYTVTTIAGSPGLAGTADGAGSTARFNFPRGIAVDKTGNVFVADTLNNTIRKITPGGIVTTFIGVAGSTDDPRQGTGSNARFKVPITLRINDAEDLYVWSSGFAFSFIIPPGQLIPTVMVSHVQKITPIGAVTALFAPNADITPPDGFAVDNDGNYYAKTDADAGRQLDGHTLSKFSPTGVRTTIAGLKGSTGHVDGIGSTARFTAINGIAIEASGNLIVADRGTYTIRRVTPAGVVTTVAGTVGKTGHVDGPANSAKFGLPYDLAVDRSGNIFITDLDTIRRISPDGNVTTIAGSVVTGTADGPGQSARFNGIGALAVDNSGRLFFADTESHTIRMIAPDGGSTGGTGTNGPSISAQPASQTVPAGTSVIFSVTAAGSGLSFQWRKDGVAIAGATGATLTLSNPQPADAGVYTVEVTNSAGSITSSPATLSVVSFVSSRLSNVSVRTTLAASQTLIVGLSMSGGSKSALLRAIGPGLAVFGVTGTMPDPRLALFDGATQVEVNDNWGGAAALASAAVSVGAFALPAASLDAAVLRAVDGARTAQVSGTVGGTVLVEAYDAGTGNTPRLVNISARNQVGTGGDILIAGFTISGSGTKTVLIRAVGPTLASFGVGGALADPKLELYSGATKIGENDTWAASLASTFGSVGAFALTAGSKDAALVTTLPAGSYTVQISGADGGTGEALVEIYEVQP